MREETYGVVNVWPQLSSRLPVFSSHSTMLVLGLQTNKRRDAQFEHGSEDGIVSSVVRVSRIGTDEHAAVQNPIALLCWAAVNNAVNTRRVWQGWDGASQRWERFGKYGGNTPACWKQSREPIRRRILV